MVLIVIDKEPRIVELTIQEIEYIIETLEFQPHSVYKFFNSDKLIDKLNKSKTKIQNN